MERFLIILSFLVVLFALSATQAERFGQDGANLVKFEGGIGVIPDFRIDDVLVPAPPAVCASPVLLIRTVGGTDPWFAVGIPKLD
jgi:hypothetical protein